MLYFHCLSSLSRLRHLFVFVLVCLAAVGMTWPVQAQTAPTPTTYIANLFGAQEAAPNNSTAYGTATLVLSADQTQATIRATLTGLKTTVTSTEIYGPAGPGKTAPPLFGLRIGGGPDYVWTFAPKNGLTVSDQINALKAGQFYINVNTDQFPDGEIRGQFYLSSGGSSGSGPTTPRPTMPTQADAVRFLEQATFGPTPPDITHVQQIGLRRYLREQYLAPASSYDGLDYVAANPTYRIKLKFFQNAFQGPDQLRQRVAFALAQILVVSTQTSAVASTDKMAFLQSYCDVLTQDAFTNYRQILEDVTLSPSMGAYLNMVNNDKPNPAKNTSPNENYAREVMQLFSIGVYKLNLDGSLQFDANFQPIPTYGNPEVTALARAFTGWTDAPLSGALMKTHNPANYTAPMVTNDGLRGVTSTHDKDPKTLVGGVTLPANQSGLQDLDGALDVIFNNPNVGPFIGRRLIQHLVTSNPSPDYVARVASVFNDNGAGVRGDMRAVVSAILLDPEAGVNTDPLNGRVREPALYIMNLLRGMNASGDLWGIPDLSAQLGQDLFNSATVFSFYQPDYRLFYTAPDGTVLSFFGPEAQTMTTNTTLSRLNAVNTLVYGKIGVPTGPVPPTGATSVTLDWTQWDALAKTSDPSALIEALNQQFLHGTMSDAMRADIKTAVVANAVSNPVTAAQAHTRAEAAVYLVTTSAQYQVAQ